jgi:hypothetical protein
LNIGNGTHPQEADGQLILLLRRDGCHQHKKGKGFAKVSKVEPVWN